MLVIQRKLQERVCIFLPSGEKVWITLVAINPNRDQVRLGFEADESVRIWREELLPQKTGEK